MNNKRGLLAVVMALAMVFAATTILVDEADADPVAGGDGATEVAYVSSDGNDGSGAVGDRTKPFKTVMGAVKQDNVGEIVLLSNVDWFASPDSDDIAKAITIRSDGTAKYTIKLTTSVSVTDNLTIQNCTINTTGDDWQFVVNSNATIKTEGCTFTTESTVTDPHAVNTRNAGGAEFINTDFSNMKVTYVTTEIVMVFKNCQNVYVNTGMNVSVYKLAKETVTSTLTDEGIYIDDETDVSSFKIYQGITVTVSSEMNLVADRILVKDETKFANIATITGSGSITGTFVLYEPEVDGNEHADVYLQTITFAGRNTITEDVQVTVKSATVASDAILSVAGEVTLYEEGGSTGTLTNNGKIFVISEGASIPAIIGGTGSVDSSAVQEDAYFGGRVVTENTVFSRNQIVNIVADTELKNALLVIKGTLVVPEGVTLTLSEGSAIWIYGAESKLYNNGTIVVASDGRSTGDGYPRTHATNKVPIALGVYGGYVENNGSIYLSCEREAFIDNYSLYIEGAIFDNNGEIQIDEFNVLGICVKEASAGTPAVGEKTILNNNADATITVEGMLVGYVDNASTVVIDGTAWGYISLVTTDAAVDVISMQGYSAGLRIDNEGLFIKKDTYVTTTGAEKVGAASSISLNTRERGYSIGGFTIGTAFAYDSVTKVYSPYIDVSGAVSGETNADSDSNTVIEVGTVALAGDVRVTGTLSVSDEVDVSEKSEGSNAKLSVSGEMVLETYVAGEFAVPTVEVTGKLVSTKKIMTSVTTIVASYYEIKEDKANEIEEQHIYTNFADAVSAAPKKITVYGTETKISTDIAVPTGIEITFDGANKLNVTSDGKLTVADGSKMKLATTGAEVKGVLHFENKKNLNGTVKSDVVITDDRSVTYCGIAYAMANATAGQTVTVSEGAVSPLKIEKDVTIPAGVILDTGAVDEVEVCKGATLTIDGALDLGAAELIIDLADADQTAAGAKPEGKVILNGTIVSEYGQDASIPGAYYTTTVKGVTSYYIEPVAVAAPNIATVDDLTMEIRAFATDLALGDVSFTGTTEESAAVKIFGKVNGNITLDLASVEFGAYAFKGTITNGTGTLASEGTATAGFKVGSTTADDVKKLTVSGSFTADVYKTVTASGDVVFSNFDANSVTVDGDVIVVKPSTGDVTSTITKLKVNGTVTVDNDATLSVSGDGSYAEVLGSVAAIPATDSKGAGKVNVTDLYLGLTEKMVTGAGAAISENVSVSGYMYVVDGSTFPADMVEGKKYVALYVEDALWMTVYYMGADSAPVVEVSEVPVENVKLVDWVDDKGTSKTKDVEGKDTFQIDVNDKKLYAKIDYNVYQVQFFVSEGVDDVYIDGVLVPTVDGAMKVNVAAGTHTVSYTLANGYTGTAKMLVDGKEVSGLTFTAEGDVGTTFNITLQGIEKAPAEVGGGDAPTVIQPEKDEGMSLTDILLIVLVVLIVIMAVIVALRMMRS